MEQFPDQNCPSHKRRRLTPPFIDSLTRPLTGDLKGLTDEETATQIANGYRAVFFEYCCSFILATIRRPSPIYLLSPNDRAWKKRIGYSLLSLIAGWWGVPWG